MKITRKQLRQIIKEELSIISEGPGSGARRDDMILRFEFERGESGLEDGIVNQPQKLS